jgi:hypothetical protein
MQLRENVDEPLTKLFPIKARSSKSISANFNKIETD